MVFPLQVVVGKTQKAVGEVYSKRAAQMGQIVDGRIVEAPPEIGIFQQFFKPLGKNIGISDRIVQSLHIINRTPVGKMGIGTISLEFQNVVAATQFAPKHGMQAEIALGSRVQAGICIDWALRVCGHDIDDAAGSIGPVQGGSRTVDYLYAFGQLQGKLCTYGHAVYHIGFYRKAIKQDLGVGIADQSAHHKQLALHGRPGL